MAKLVMAEGPTSSLNVNEVVINREAGAITEHNELAGRNALDSHPITAISGLVDAFDITDVRLNVISAEIVNIKDLIDLLRTNLEDMPIIDVSTINERLALAEGRITVIENLLVENELGELGDLTAIINDLAMLKIAVADIEEKLVTLMSGQEELQENIDLLKDQLTELEDGITVSLSEIEEDIENLKNTTGTLAGMVSARGTIKANGDLIEGSNIAAVLHVAVGIYQIFFTVPQTAKYTVLTQSEEEAKYNFSVPERTANWCYINVRQGVYGYYDVQFNFVVLN